MSHSLLFHSLIFLIIYNSFDNHGREKEERESDERRKWKWKKGITADELFSILQTIRHALSALPTVMMTMAFREQVENAREGGKKW